MRMRGSTMKSRSGITKSLRRSMVHKSIRSRERRRDRGCNFARLSPRALRGPGTAHAAARRPRATGSSQWEAARSLQMPSHLSLSLTLADLGGVCERVLHALPNMPRNFDTVPPRTQPERNLMRPYFDRRERSDVPRCPPQLGAFNFGLKSNSDAVSKICD